MKNLYFRGLVFSPLVVILFMIDLHAQSFVYTNNSLPGPNSVTAFSVAANGALTNIGTFATGGAGGGLRFFASNRARTCMVGNRLYVANDGSNSVSGFDINTFTGALSLVPGSPFPTNGIAGPGISLDCLPDGKFLIAANGESDDITVFSIAANGALSPVAGSPFAAGGLSPDGIKVAPNGQFLSVALADSDAIGMFSIAANGALAPAPGSPFASPAIGGVAGVEINCASSFLYGAQAVLGGTHIDVFSIGPNGALTLVQTSNNPGVGNNSNVGVLSPNDQFLFVSNQGSTSVTVFDVAADGTLSLVPGSPFGGTGEDPCGIATNPDGTFLFTANRGSSTVTSFSIAGNGALTLVGNFVTGQLADTGLASLAVFPGKSCSTFIFDVCLQDDSNPSTVFLGNSQTGAYRFCCGGTVFTGLALVTRRGNTVTFQDNAPDRRVLVTDDQSAHRGKASLQSPPGIMKCTIADRNTTNNSCACG
jgi:6-phosphogluconolactonase (cycloisomerase 2 family)